MIKQFIIIGILIAGKITAAEVADQYNRLYEQMQKLKLAGVAFPECAEIFERPINRTGAIMNTLVSGKDGALNSPN